MPPKAGKVKPEIQGLEVVSSKFKLHEPNDPTPARPDISLDSSFDWLGLKSNLQTPSSQINQRLGCSRKVELLKQNKMCRALEAGRLFKSRKEQKKL